MLPEKSRFSVYAIAIATFSCALQLACHKPADPAQQTAASPETAELTKQLRRFSFEKRRLPEKLEDLVAVGYLSAIPPAPAGKKFQIDAKRVEVILAEK